MALEMSKPHFDLLVSVAERSNTGVPRNARIPRVNLPDPDDRHVVAAAIATGASIILTWNLRDFPATALKKYSLRGQTPDAFFADIYDQAPDLAVGSLANARHNLRSRVSASDFVDILNNQKLRQLAKRVRSRLADL